MTAAILLLAPNPVISASFPVSFSVKGGVGSGYFSMNEINSQISRLRQAYNTNLSQIEKGTQICVDGRIWFFDKFAVIAGFEHYWAESAMNTGDFSIIHKLPATVFLVGGAVTVLSIPAVMDINIGARGSYTKATYESNEENPSSTRLGEYKNNSHGWDVFVEATTNFPRPIEWGVMLGYRNSRVDNLKNKFRDPAIHVSSGDYVVLDYSGMFFYITTGIRLW